MSTPTYIDCTPVAVGPAKTQVFTVTYGDDFADLPVEAYLDAATNRPDTDALCRAAIDLAQERCAMFYLPARWEAQLKSDADALPDDGYADGGEPYSEVELALMQYSGIITVTLYHQ